MPKNFSNPSTIHPPSFYTHVVTVTDSTMIYLAGQVAWDKDGNLVGENDLGAQTEQILKNIMAALESVGATLDDVIKTTMFIVNYKTSYRPILAEVFSRYFNMDNPPPNTLLGVQALAREDLMIEIEVVAAIDNKPE
jgi:enamine deaminase RidA (YjgF/YER057c/UK114 family)